MFVFKCKMCGGTIEFNQGDTVGTCDSCGTQQTLPKIEDEKKANLYDRANHYRRSNDFDKAMGIYEQILDADNTDAEAYWSLVLCRYGIEYVEDPATHKRVPTVNRAQYTSIFADEDYKSALQHADSYQRTIYESEAKAIDDIQKGILEISNKEKPFDVFICYKETDNNGQRTQDSVLANDLYYQLTQEGFKVFFARITLEDKLGSAYEPYIFAALNSAKVMMVLGTKPEYFNAVWVKNEWSRYLTLVKKSGGKKVLIPAYRDMDPYDLPEEFSHLQAQDMSKLGFMQDLIRGIKKIIDADAPKESTKETVIVQQTGGNTTVAAQLQRGNMALEDHEWDKADSFFEEALNLDPKCAQAYIGKLLSRDKKPGFDSWIATQKVKYANVTTSEKAIACPEDSEHIQKIVDKMTLAKYLSADEIRKQYSYDRSYGSTFQPQKSLKAKQQSELANDRLLARAKQYSTGETKKQIDDGIAAIATAWDDRIAKAQNEDAQKASNRKAAYAAFLAEADKKTEKLYNAALEKREQDYNSAVAAVNEADTVEKCETAIESLKLLDGYKNCNALIAQCRQTIDRINEEERIAAEKKAEEDRIAAEKKAEERRIALQKFKKAAIIAAAAALAIFIVVNVLTKLIIPNIKYNDAVELMNGGNYDEAIAAFEAMDGYKDSADMILECNYGKAVALMNEGSYEEAIDQFEALNGYKDSADQIAACKKGITDDSYDAAVALMNQGKYDEAIAAFETMEGYKDSENKIFECYYGNAVSLMNSGEYFDAIAKFNSADGFNDSAEQIAKCKQLALLNAQAGEYVYFGSYEQDADSTNGKEDIAWLVLDEEEDKVLVVSEYVLDCQKYNEKYGETTWSNCSLRGWLNDDFIINAFSEDEQSMLVEATVSADKNPNYSTDPGSSTQDKVFLLGIDEIDKYKEYLSLRNGIIQNGLICAPTEYATIQGVSYTDDENQVNGKATYKWFLRTPGYSQYYAAVVQYDGEVKPYGIYVNTANIGIRPALWIDLSNLETEVAE